MENKEREHARLYIFMVAFDNSQRAVFHRLGFVFQLVANIFLKTFKVLLPMKERRIARLIIINDVPQKLVIIEDELHPSREYWWT